MTTRLSIAPAIAPAIAPVLASVLLCACWSAAMAAETADVDIGNAMLRSSASTEKDVGIVAGSAPRYVGSTRYQGFAGVDVEANFGNGVFFSSRSGLGYRFLETPSGWSMAASLGASPARHEKDGGEPRNRLAGMGDVNAKPQANLFLNYDQGPWHASAALHQTLASRHGTAFDLTGGYDVLATHDNLVRVDAGIEYGNRALMQTFFSVTPQQATGAVNPAYTAHGGLAGESLGVTWRHAFGGGHWVSTLGAGVTHLDGSAWDSPLSQKRVTGVVTAGLSYRF